MKSCSIAVYIFILFTGCKVYQNQKINIQEFSYSCANLKFTDEVLVIDNVKHYLDVFNKTNNEQNWCYCDLPSINYGQKALVFFKIIDKEYTGIKDQLMVNCDSVNKIINLTLNVELKKHNTTNRVHYQSVNYIRNLIIDKPNIEYQIKAKIDKTMLN